MAEEEEKWQKILRELKRSEIKGCVPRVEELMKKHEILHSDVVDLLTHVVNILSSKKPKKGYRFRPTVRFSDVVIGETFGAHDTIVEKVEKKQTYTTLQKCDIIIVFCPITSRIGSDVEAVKRHEAVSSTNKPVIVVLMHHTRDEVFSPGERKWFEDPRFVLEVHVFYHETQRGLLKCAHNKQAVKKIKKQLRKHRP